MRSWFDWRATTLALVLAVAAALPFMTIHDKSRDRYYFEVTLTTSLEDVSQLFWDTGRGISERDSSRLRLKPGPEPVVYRFPMPIGDIQGLRFDPVDGGTGTFNLAHARIVDFRGEVVQAFSPSDFKAGQQIARLETKGDVLKVELVPKSQDPILRLELPRPLHLVRSTGLWLGRGLWVAVPVFLLGLLLGSPLIASRLQRLVGPLGLWLRARPRTAIVLVAAVAVTIQCHPVIFLGGSFVSPNNASYMLYSRMPTLPGYTDNSYAEHMGSDTGALLFNHMYYAMVQRDALLQHGELPLWNRYSLCGEPLLGQGQSMFGDPFNFLTILADGAAWAWDVRYVLAHWLFAVGLGFTVWQLTRRFGASLLVTLGSVFIAFFTYRINHPSSLSECYSPWILWAWVGLIQSSAPRRLAAWLLALVAAHWLVFTSGTVKEAYMLIACLDLTGVVLLAMLPEAQGRRWQLFNLAACAGGVFVLLSAPGWMSFLVSWRHSYTWYDQPSATTLPVAQLIGFFDDIFYRQTSVNGSVTAPALNFLFMIGVLWWLVTPRLWRQDRAGLALLLSGVPPFVLAFGLVPDAVLLRVPFLANIHHVGDTFSCPLLINAIVLAGCGFVAAADQLRADGGWRRFGLVIVLVAGLLAAFLVSARDFPKNSFFDGYVPALLLAGLALVVGLGWGLRSGRAGPIWVALVLGLPVLLWRFGQYNETLFNHYAFYPGPRCDLHARSPGEDFVDQQRREPGRVVGWGNCLYPSYNTLLRWEGIYGVDALRNRYFQDLATEFSMRRVWMWEWSNGPEEATRLVPIHDVMNVTKYIADHAQPPVDFAGLTLVGQYDLDVYTSPTAWPRAFFTDRLASYESVNEFGGLIRNGDGRPFAATQAGTTGAPALPADLAGRTVRAATDYRLTNNNTTFVVDASGPGVAVLSEAYYEDDFKVTVDGKPAPFFRVNHAFKGVAIPTAGRHEVTFAYWPQHFTLALGLGAVGLLLLVAGFAWLWRMRPAPGAAAG